MFTKPTDSDNRQRVWKYVLVGVIALMGVVVLVHATLASNGSGNNGLVRRSALRGMIGDSELVEAVADDPKIYYLTFLSDTFEQVRSRCKSEGGKLATIISGEQNGKVMSQCNQQKRCWIGLKRKVPHGTIFEWKDSPNLPNLPYPDPHHHYNNWKGGEPNDKNKEEECVEMYGKSSGKWNDQSCLDKIPGVCQKDGPPRFFLTDSKGTFEAVKKKCDDKNGVLTSLKEGDVAEAASVCPRNSDCYIGLTKQGPNNGWHWVGGSQDTFRNWKDKVPHHEHKQCAKMITSSGKWTDVKCSTKLFGICRHKPGH